MRRVILLLLLAVLCGTAAIGASLKGEIAEVRPENKAVMSKGSESGIEPGMVFVILNDAFSQVGTFTILETSEGSATGIYYMKNADVQPEAGMIVVYGEEAPAPEGEYMDLVVPEQTVVELQLAETIGSQISKTGDVFTMTVKYPVVVKGFEVISAGAKAYGEITQAKAAKGWGRSGELDFTVKFVEAADGTHIPLAFDVQRDEKNSYGKAALGTYLTAGLGGGAMKGKKISLETGAEMKVFVPEDVTMKVRAGGVTQGGAVSLEERVRKSPADTRVVFVGLNDSFNAASAPEGRAVAEKISAFLSYAMQWRTPFQFVHRSAVVEAVRADFQAYFLTRNPGAEGATRYSLDKLKTVANQFQADYVIIGDVLQHDIIEKTNRDWGKTLLNIATPVESAAEGLDSLKKVFLMDVAIDIAVYDAARDTIFWTYVYKGSHKTSQVLHTIESGSVVDIGDSKYFVSKLKDYQFKRSDDPLAYAGTAEGEAVLQTLESLFVELQKLL